MILSERLYGDGASRESGDIDILVAPDRLEDAVAVAREEFLYDAPRDAIAPTAGRFCTTASPTLRWTRAGGALARPLVRVRLRRDHARTQ